MSSDPHEEVYIPRLLLLSGLADTEARGIMLVNRGEVYVERWNLGRTMVTLPRWVLRGTTITVGERSIKISDDGSKIVRAPERKLALS